MANSAQAGDETQAMAADTTEEELERELGLTVPDYSIMPGDALIDAPAGHKTRPVFRITSLRLPLPAAFLVAGAALGAAVVQLVFAALGHGWPFAVLGGVALLLSVYGIFLGALGVIRFGLFTEGLGVAKIDAERRKAHFAYWIAGISQAAFLTAVAGLVVFLVLSLV